MSRIMNINELPHELYPFMLEYEPKLKVMDVTDPKHSYLYFMTFEITIEYINHFMKTKIDATFSRKLCNVLFLESRINDFIDKINMKVPVELNLSYHYKTRSKNLHYNEPDINIEVEKLDQIPSIKIQKENIDENFIVVSDTIQDHSMSLIKYTGHNFIINDIILPENGYYLVCDLLTYIKSSLYQPEK